MQTTRGKYVPPSAKPAAFSCPHCGSLTTQYWFELYARPLEDDNGLPHLCYPTDNGTPFEHLSKPVNGEPIPESVLAHWREVASGKIINNEMADSAYVRHVFTIYICRSVLHA